MDAFLFDSVQVAPTKKEASRRTRKPPTTRDKRGVIKPWGTCCSPKLGDVKLESIADPWRIKLSNHYAKAPNAVATT